MRRDVALYHGTGAWRRAHRGGRRFLPAPFLVQDGAFEVTVGVQEQQVVTGTTGRERSSERSAWLAVERQRRSMSLRWSRQSRCPLPGIGCPGIRKSPRPVPPRADAGAYSQRSAFLPLSKDLMAPDPYRFDASRVTTTIAPTTTPIGPYRVAGRP
jgi:hypothetical protein